MYARRYAQQRASQPAFIMAGSGESVTFADFEAELPRLPPGKLYERLLRDRYWGDQASRIV